MGDLPPSVTEEWVRELVGDIGVFSYLKVLFQSLGTDVDSLMCL